MGLVMSFKYAGVMFAFATVAFAAIFTLFSAYMSCMDAQKNVRRARAELVKECDQLGMLATRIGALTLKYLPEKRNTVKRAEYARKRMDEQRSIRDMARACSVLHSSLKVMVTSLKAHNVAADDYRFLDAARSFKEVTHRLSMARGNYDRVADKHNETLEEPLPVFWRYLLDFAPEERFAVKRRVKGRGRDLSG